MKILVVEDDKDALDLTVYSLRKHGYQVIAGRDGEQALEQWESENPDLVVLDVGLPKVNGFEVCRRIRETSLTPVIMLTGKSEEEQVVHGFRQGADDYVTKPFSHRQLAMRIQAVLNRCAERPFAAPRGDVSTTDMRLDLQSHEVTRQGRTVRLTPLEFRILYLLATNEGQVIGTQRLIEHAWGFEGGESSLLKTHVCHIRRKLGMKDGSGPYIKSVPWVGYQLTRE
jgi:DNA-binding response OmpR family regulator